MALVAYGSSDESETSDVEENPPVAVNREKIDLEPSSVRSIDAQKENNTATLSSSLLDNDALNNGADEISDEEEFTVESSSMVSSSLSLPAPKDTGGAVGNDASRSKTSTETTGLLAGWYWLGLRDWLSGKNMYLMV